MCSVIRIIPFLPFWHIYSRDTQIVNKVWPEDEIEDARTSVQDPGLAR